MAEVKTLKNAVSVCLGIIVRQARMELKLSYSDITAKTGIKPSYFQAFEQGKAIFHVSKSYVIFKAFKSLYPKSLNGFIEVLALISIVENRGAEFKDQYLKECGLSDVKPTIEDTNKAYSEGIIVGFRELASYNKAYYKLFRAFIHSSVLSATDNDLVVRNIQQNHLGLELISFISDYVNYAVPLGNKIGNSLSTILDEVPSMFLSYILSAKQEIRRLPRPIKAENVVEWEDRNSDRIIGLTFFMQVEFQTIDIFEDFAFTYLENKEFKKATFYFCYDFDDDNFGVDYLKEHIDRVHSRYPRRYESSSNVLAKEWDTIKTKLDFKYLLDSEYAEELFLISGTDENFFWVYEMSDNTFVGFTANTIVDTLKCLDVKQLKNSIDILNAIANLKDEDDK